MLIVVILGLAVASIVVGAIAIVKSARSNKLSAGVGLALVGIGLLLAYFGSLLWEF